MKRGDFSPFSLITFRSSTRYVDPPDDPAHGEFMEERRPGSQVQWEHLFAAAVDAFVQGAPLDQPNTADFTPHSQDDPIWLLVYWEQDGAH